MNNISKNAVIVISVNIFNLVIAILMGFVISLKLDYNNYAYYKIYQLYICFVGFAHLGLINGIYLLYGKYDYDSLPYKKFNSYLKVIILLQLIIMFAGIIITYFLFEGIESKKVYTLIFINLPLININCLFTLINQFTKRFVRDSQVILLKTFLDLILMILVWINLIDKYIPVLLFILMENIVVLICNAYNNKEIIINKNGISKEIINDCKVFLNKGFWIMLSELSAIVFLNVDNIFIEKNFSLQEFAYYSFASTIVLIFYSIINVISNLLYPYMVRMSEEIYSKCYNNLVVIILLISDILLSFISVMCFLINKFIPEYEKSCSVILILAMTIPFKAIIMLVINNFFKVLKKSVLFFASNICALFLTILFNVVALIISQRIEPISVASVLTMLLWYVCMELYFYHIFRFEKKMLLRIAFVVFIIIAYYYIGERIMCSMLFMICTVLFLLFYYKKEVRDIITIVKKIKTNE